MDYEEFVRQIELRIRKRMGEEVRVCIFPVRKNNSILLDTLSILEREDNISPAIYLNEFYKRYLTGETMERIIDNILRCYRRGKTVRKLDISFYTDISRAKKRMVCRLINSEKNRKLLEEVPHHRFLNLAIVYYYLLESCEIGEAAILVRQDHLKMWKMDAETLHRMAVENTRRLLPCDFLSMTQMMQAVVPSDLCPEEIPLYILSNKEKYFGAVWMTDADVLEKIGEELRGDYYVLPSSVHECMIVPASMDTDEKELQDMVREINETQVEPEEVLGDTVYRYDRRHKTLMAVLM